MESTNPSHSGRSSKTSGNPTFPNIAAHSGTPEKGTCARDEESFPFDLHSFASAALAQRALPGQVTVREAIGDLPSEVVESGETMTYPRPKRPSKFQRMMRLDSDGAWYSRKLKRRRGICSSQALLYNHHTKEIQERRKRRKRSGRPYRSREPPRAAGHPSTFLDTALTAFAASARISRGPAKPPPGTPPAGPKVPKELPRKRAAGRRLAVTKSHYLSGPGRATLATLPGAGPCATSGRTRRGT